MKDKVVSIDMDDGCDMLLTLESGRQLRIKHYQNCCEDVAFYDGDYLSLVGRELEDVSIEYLQNEDVDPYESSTWSVLTFQLADGAEILRWRGISNGYYSEVVDFEDITFGNKELIPPGFEDGPQNCTYDEYWSIIADYWNSQGNDLKEACSRMRLVH